LRGRPAAATALLDQNVSGTHVVGFRPPTRFPPDPHARNHRRSALLSPVPRPEILGSRQLGPDLFLSRARDARGRFAKESSGNPRGIPNPRRRVPDLAARPLSAQALSDLLDRKPHLLRPLNGDPAILAPRLTRMICARVAKWPSAGRARSIGAACRRASGRSRNSPCPALREKAQRTCKCLIQRPFWL
jgi:hypothetical protein